MYVCMYIYIYVWVTCVYTYRSIYTYIHRLYRREAFGAHLGHALEGFKKDLPRL